MARNIRLNQRTLQRGMIESLCFRKWVQIVSPLKCIFPAGTSEIDQLYKIASILGTPGRSDWQDGHALAAGMNFRFPPFKPTHLTAVLGPRSSARAVSLLYALLAWNPAWRASAQEALRHSYFRMAQAGAKGSPTAAHGVRSTVNDNKINQVKKT